MPMHYTKVSEWVEQGAFKSGLALVEIDLTAETEKAFQVVARKWNRNATDLKKCPVWLPKSQVFKVLDDLYEKKSGKTCFLVPFWFIHKKEKEGYLL